MVWLHGGGFFSFSGATAFCDGVRLAKRGDVVVVTLNHRLGVLGFTYLNPWLGPDYAGSGNAGMLDIVLALEWVRDNIAEFGGNPNNITVFGESGGGAKVSCLMAMPVAKGLFHRAIVQSGSTLRMREKTVAARVTKSYLDTLKLPVERVADMTTMPLDRLMTPSMNLSFDRLMNMSPVVGDDALPRHPFDPDAPSVSAHVPMLIGSCHDESTLMYGLRDPSLFDLTWDSLIINLSKWFPETDPGLIRGFYCHNYPEYGPSDIFFRATCDFGILRAAITQAERKYEQAGAAVYMYEFNYKSKREGGKFKATHADELSYVFDTLPTSSLDPENERINLVDEISGSWVAFARSGTPNNRSVPSWPSYDTTMRATMAFDKETAVVCDPRGAERRLFPNVTAVVGPFEFLKGAILE
jgi:para-nitrobenzyl esterase